MRTSVLTITRAATDGYINGQGRWVDGTPIAPFDIDCNIQPFSQGDSQIILPEGKKSSGAQTVRTDTLLQTVLQVGTKTPADETTIDGLLYEAFDFLNWSRYGLSADHYEVVFVRKDQPTNGSL